jgi:hypothetical protein
MYSNTHFFFLAHYKSGLTLTQKCLLSWPVFCVKFCCLEKWGTQIVQEPSHCFVLSFGKADTKKKIYNNFVVMRTIFNSVKQRHWSWVPSSRSWSIWKHWHVWQFQSEHHENTLLEVNKYLEPPQPKKIVGFNIKITNYTLILYHLPNQTQEHLNIRNGVSFHFLKSKLLIYASSLII